MSTIPYQYKFVIVVRKDLDMGCGKIAAQVGHAIAYMMNEPRTRLVDDWFYEGQRKVVLKAKDDSELLQVADKAAQAGLNVFYVRDAGRTQIPSGSLTCVGIGPAKEETINEVTGGLKLL